MSSKTREFARIVLEAFTQAGHHTDAEVAKAGGPSTSTMTNLRKAASDEKYDLVEPRSDTLKRVESAAGWPVGFARKVWISHEPRRRIRDLDAHGQRHAGFRSTHEEVAQQSPVENLRDWLQEGAEGQPPFNALSLWGIDDLLAEVRRRVEEGPTASSSSPASAAGGLASWMHLVGHDASASPNILIMPSMTHAQTDGYSGQTDPDEFLREVLVEAARTVEHRGKAAGRDRTAQDAVVEAPDPDGPEHGA